MVREVTDMMGFNVKVPVYPKRIVSLVPSQTELLCDLGVQDRLAGITKFCVHPDEAFKTIPHVGGTKNIDIEKLAAVKPDLIIGNKEENTRAEIEALRVFYPVWMSDIKNLYDALNMIKAMGDLVQANEAAENMAASIQQGFNSIEVKAEQRALYLIWRKPWMAAGIDTFINTMLRYAGYKNIAPSERYPELSYEDIKALNPQVILLSSEPYPFTDKHIAELKELLPHADIKLVDGEMFSWYGSRLLKAVGYFKGLRYV